MSNSDKIRLKYELSDGFVDLSKPYNTDRLYYEVLADNDVQPDKENTLYLTIRGKCFNEIMSAEKTVEYRDIKDTTYRKYLQIDGSGNFNLRDDFPDVDYALDFYYNGYFPFLPKPYKYLKLAVGYNKDRDWAIVEVVGISFEPATDKNGNIVRFNETKSGLHFTPDGELAAWIIAFHLGKVVEYYPNGVKAKLDQSNFSEPAVKYEKRSRPASSRGAATSARHADAMGKSLPIKSLSPNSTG
ncbi:MAG: hypothetical protein QM237_08315 [Bacteroidota bacterium]|jgi:hypothetical protein|nr:hypothetical protein [Bacteroidota bacterium]HHU97115.1 hypothetical protein [Petrimonas sp.]